MQSKEPRLDRDSPDYSGLDDDAEEENRFSARGSQETVSLPNVDDGERQPAWADLLHGDNVACSPTDPSNVLEDRVHQLETQVIWNKSKNTRLFLAVQIRVH